ncbi:MAG: methionine--tRNA ligase [Chthonomonas sp.]|nr:methionine--tRNA ligase [Chthonomonas sp.]
MKKFYVTTPIYYVNSVPHAGHALTMMAADVVKRYQQMHGREAVFLTGTDENGTKVMEAAATAGETTQAFVDRISATFADCARDTGCDVDIFFRTSSQRHYEAAQALFAKLQENGHIFLDKYEGWYDVSAETFVKESDLVDGKSPDGNEVRWVSEENYFFRLSAFAEPLLAKIEAEPNWILPESRKNEVVSFIKQGLRDMCVSRSNPGWGIPVPGDDSKVIYVWFDALINYLAASGWPNAGWEELWPADIHWMGKEILTRFHATLWPAMLMGADLPLPTSVVAHGWFTFNDAKMSKSLGNVLGHNEIMAFFRRMGCSDEMAVDALRFSLIRVLPFESDSNFTLDEIAKNFNADLANDLGNALNRSLSMVHKFAEGVVPTAAPEAAQVARVVQLRDEAAAHFATHRYNLALNSALEVVRELNRYIAEAAPWTLAKEGDARLSAVLATMLFMLRSAEGMIRPFMPSAANELARQLGYDATQMLTEWSRIGDPATMNVGGKVLEPSPMFPRIDLKLMETEKPQAPAAPAAPAPKKEKPKFEQPAEIDITDFMKVKLQVARILEAEPVEGSQKLVKLQVILGEERRQVLAGIRASYEPADLVGRQVIVVANLKPAKLMGHESQGMILAADGPDGTAILLQPEAEAPEGTSVH